MNFTYNAYEQLIDSLKRNEYAFCDYHNYSQFKKAVILRHDIDMDIKKAVELARIEYNMDIKSTYYVLISSDFYNAFSKKNISFLKCIRSMGHDIGLHFDEEKYEDGISVLDAIEREINILELFLECKVSSVSMHRPSKKTLSSDYLICSGNVINSYGKEFFENFKYVSDSRRNWREDVISIVESGQYNRLHILTHPIWYSHSEKSAKEVLRDLCNQKIFQCYDSLDNNIRDLGSILTKEDL